jgi:SET domain-containing protein 6
MKALKSIAKGEEIYNDYGALPRSELLRNYGYITPNYTQYDVVGISMDLYMQKVKGLFDIDDKTITKAVSFFHIKRIQD